MSDSCASAPNQAANPGAPEYAVIVVGAGHAGCEAALAAARMGSRTLLLTMNLDLIAQMPCNPSVGGSAKGQLVREIDALGGEMGRNIDRTSIQIRMLNLSKGPAVQALRAQADKRLYSLSMKHTLEQTPNLDLKQGQVETLLVEGGSICGVRLTSGPTFSASAVVICSGTFLNGRILCGEYAKEAGRAGEFSARGLSRSLKEQGFELRRLQTNTPPRVDARTVRFQETVPQFGSDAPLYFSFEMPDTAAYQLPINPVYPIAYQTAWRPQMPCYLVRTSAATHRVIRDNLHRSPIAPGKNDASGPRYCPSIEDKIAHFPHKESHQFFLEPEGWSTTEVYVQGCFTGLPSEVQLELLRTIPALSSVEIIRPGYAIEYDYVPSYQIKSTLETRLVRGLYLAGQINGTSGYEEAAAQGLLAGIEAALQVTGRPPVHLERDQAYLGVLVDDLVTKDITEPYRMMTSRAEYRLLLRGDNADLRLTPTGYQIGLVTADRYRGVEDKRNAIAAEISRLDKVTLHPGSRTDAILQSHQLEPLRSPTSARQFLRRPGASYDTIDALVPSQTRLRPEVVEQVSIEIHYEGYIRKQMSQVARVRRLEDLRIPEAFDYGAVIGLRNEAQERLAWHRPETVGKASRIQGVNPADISVLLVYIEKYRRSPHGEEITERKS